MSYWSFDLNRSITKKQIVAITGLLLIIFIIVHLGGNLFIFAGPTALNGYTQKLSSFGPLLKMAEWALFIIFTIHILLTASLVLDNIQARGGISRYAIDNSKRPRWWETRLMPYSGTYLLIYLVWHLLDFQWANQAGPRSMMGGVSYGLYGVVVNSFKNPLHSWLYVLAMFFLALHLAHGFQSFLQTFGLNDKRMALSLKRFSRWFALVMMLAYSSIPLYVLYVLKI